jgi:hypothetical protein
VDPGSSYLLRSPHSNEREPRWRCQSARMFDLQLAVEHCAECFRREVGEELNCAHRRLFGTNSNLEFEAWLITVASKECASATRNVETRCLLGAVLFMKDSPGWVMRWAWVHPLARHGAKNPMLKLWLGSSSGTVIHFSYRDCSAQT